MMHRVLITGASRGLGLAFSKRYATAGWRVFACCRRPHKAVALQRLAQAGRLSVHQLDVADHGQIRNLANELRAEPIDLLLNNAGVYGFRSGFGSIDYQEWRRVLAINVMAPIRMAESFVDHVAHSRRKLMVAITSKMGSISDNTSGNSYIYRTSKTALNMAFKSMAVDLASRAIACAVIHPGWVKTDMGGPNAPIDTDASATGVFSVIEGLSLESSGKFYNYDGREIPW